MTEFLTQPAFEIGLRADLRGGYAWFVILKPAEERDALANFVTDLSVVLDKPVRVVNSIGSIERLHNELNAPADDPILIPDLDGADAERWSALDVNRSGLSREGTVVLWLSSDGLANLCEFAPNIRSFVGGSIFTLGSDGGAMTDAERVDRIAQLEAHFQMTSADVISRAQADRLPAEPHFVEWLVLLDRGDLV